LSGVPRTLTGRSIISTPLASIPAPRSSGPFPPQFPAVRQALSARISQNLGGALASRNYTVPEPVVWATFVFWMGFAGAFWLAINLCAATLLMPIAVLVHELGHALVGRLMGLRVFVINLGQGPPLCRFEVTETRVIIGRFPIHGYVRMVPEGGPNQRLRVGAAILAGPITHLLWIAAITLLWPTSFGSLEGWQAFNTQFAPLHGFVFFNILVFLRNLVPLGTNDGALLVHLILARQLHLSDAFDIALALDRLDRNDNEAALRLLDQAIAAHPEEDSLRLNRGTALLRLDRLDEALALWEPMYVDPSCPSARRLGLANNMAMALIFRGSTSDLDRANTLSSEALDAIPRDDGFLSTRGAYRIATGEHVVGERLVRRALKTLTDPIQRSECFAWLALSARASGKTRAAQRYTGLIDIPPHPRLQARLTQVH
jgi:hypothetical protein